MRSATQLEEEWRVRGERAAEYSAKLEAALTMAEGEAVALRRRARRTRRARREAGAGAGAGEGGRRRGGAAEAEAEAARLREEVRQAEERLAQLPEVEGVEAEEEEAETEAGAAEGAVEAAEATAGAAGGPRGGEEGAKQLAEAGKRLRELENAAGVWREIAEHAARETVLAPEVAGDAGWRQLVAEVEDGGGGGGGGGGDAAAAAAAALAATGDDGPPSPVASGARRVVAVVAVSMRWEVGTHIDTYAHTHTLHMNTAHTHDVWAARALRHCAACMHATVLRVRTPGARQAPRAAPHAAEPRGC